MIIDDLDTLRPPKPEGLGPRMLPAALGVIERFTDDAPHLGREFAQVIERRTDSRRAALGFHSRSL